MLWRVRFGLDLGPKFSKMFRSDTSIVFHGVLLRSPLSVRVQVPRVRRENRRHLRPLQGRAVGVPPGARAEVLAHPAQRGRGPHHAGRRALAGAMLMSKFLF